MSEGGEDQGRPGGALSRLLPEGSLRQRFVGAAFWMSLAMGAAQLGRLLSALIVTRILGDQRTGDLGILRSGVETLIVVAGLGLTMTATRWIAFSRGASPEWVSALLGKVTRVTWASGLIACTLLLIGADWLAADVQGSADLAFCYRLMAPSALFMILVNLQTATLAGLQVFRRLSWASITHSLISTILLPVGCVVAGLPGVAAAMSLAALGGWLIHRWVLHDELRKAGLHIGTEPLSNWGEIVRGTAVPSLATGLLMTPVIYLANSLCYVMPGGSRQLGYMAVAEQWRQPVLMVPTILDQVLLPIATEQLSAGNVRRARKIFLVTLAGLSLIAGTLALVGILAREHIVAIYGPDFAPAAPVLGMFLLATFLTAVAGSTNRFLASMGRFWAGFFINVVWAILLVVGTLWFGRVAYGLAQAHVLANLGQFVLAGCFALWMLRSMLRQRPGTTGTVAS